MQGAGCSMAGTPLASSRGGGFVRASGKRCRATMTGQARGARHDHGEFVEFGRLPASRAVTRCAAASAARSASCSRSPAAAYHRAGVAVARSFANARALPPSSTQDPQTRLDRLRRIQVAHGSVPNAPVVSALRKFRDLEQDSAGLPRGMYCFARAGGGCTLLQEMHFWMQAADVCAAAL